MLDPSTWTKEQAIVWLVENPGIRAVIEVLEREHTLERLDNLMLPLAPIDIVGIAKAAGYRTGRDLIRTGIDHGDA